MSSVAAEVKLKFTTVSKAAKRLGITYFKLNYDIGKGYIELYQRNPDLIEEEELKRYAKENNFQILD